MDRTMLPYGLWPIKKITVEELLEIYPVPTKRRSRMTLQDIWMWMDALQMLAFDSAEPLEDRAFYARWWTELADAMTAEMDPGLEDCTNPLCCLDQEA